MLHVHTHFRVLVHNPSKCTLRHNMEQSTVSFIDDYFIDTHYTITGSPRGGRSAMHTTLELTFITAPISSMVLEGASKSGAITNNIPHAIAFRLRPIIDDIPGEVYWGVVWACYHLHALYEEPSITMTIGRNALDSPDVDDDPKAYMQLMALNAVQSTRRVMPTKYTALAGSDLWYTYLVNAPITPDRLDTHTLTHANLIWLPRATAGRRVTSKHVSDEQLNKYLLFNAPYDMAVRVTRHAERLFRVAIFATFDREAPIDTAYIYTRGATIECANVDVLAMVLRGSGARRFPVECRGFGALYQEIRTRLRIADDLLPRKSIPSVLSVPTPFVTWLWTTSLATSADRTQLLDLVSIVKDLRQVARYIEKTSGLLKNATLLQASSKVLADNVSVEQFTRNIKALLTPDKMTAVTELQRVIKQLRPMYDELQTVQSGIATFSDKASRMHDIVRALLGLIASMTVPVVDVADVNNAIARLNETLHDGNVIVSTGPENTYSAISESIKTAIATIHTNTLDMLAPFKSMQKQQDTINTLEVGLRQTQKEHRDASTRYDILLGSYEVAQTRASEMSRKYDAASRDLRDAKASNVATMAKLQYTTGALKQQESLYNAEVETRDGIRQLMISAIQEIHSTIDRRYPKLTYQKTQLTSPMVTASDLWDAFQRVQTKYINALLADQIRISKETENMKASLETHQNAYSELEKRVESLSIQSTEEQENAAQLQQQLVDMITRYDAEVIRGNSLQELHVSLQQEIAQQRDVTTQLNAAAIASLREQNRRDVADMVLELATERSRMRTAHQQKEELQIQITQGLEDARQTKEAVEARIRDVSSELDNSKQRIAELEMTVKKRTDEYTKNTGNLTANLKRVELDLQTSTRKCKQLQQTIKDLTRNVTASETRVRTLEVTVREMTAATALLTKSASAIHDEIEKMSLVVLDTVDTLEARDDADTIKYATSHFADIKRNLADISQQRDDLLDDSANKSKAITQLENERRDRIEVAVMSILGRFSNSAGMLGEASDVIVGMMPTVQATTDYSPSYWPHNSRTAPYFETLQRMRTHDYIRHISATLAGPQARDKLHSIAGQIPAPSKVTTILEFYDYDAGDATIIRNVKATQLSPVAAMRISAKLINERITTRGKRHASLSLNVGNVTGYVINVTADGSILHANPTDTVTYNAAYTRILEELERQLSRYSASSGAAATLLGTIRRFQESHVFHPYIVNTRAPENANSVNARPLYLPTIFIVANDTWLANYVVPRLHSPNVTATPEDYLYRYSQYDTITARNMHNRDMSSPSSVVAGVLNVPAIGWIRLLPNDTLWGAVDAVICYTLHDEHEIRTAFLSMCMIVMKFHRLSDDEYIMDYMSITPTVMDIDSSLQSYTLSTREHATYVLRDVVDALHARDTVPGSADIDMNELPSIMLDITNPAQLPNESIKAKYAELKTIGSSGMLGDDIALKMRMLPPSTPVASEEVSGVANVNLEDVITAVSTTNVTYKLTARRIRGDGNCMFRAFSSVLYGDETRHMEIRRKIVDWLNTNKRRWIDTHAPDVPLSVDTESDDQHRVTASHASYIRKMSTDGEWGDDYCVVAAQYALKCQIRIFAFSDEMRKYYIYDFEEYKAATNLIRLHLKASHYDVITHALET